MQEVEAQISKHEAVCAERWQHIKDILDRIDKRTEDHGKSIQEINIRYTREESFWRGAIKTATLFGTCTAASCGIVIGIIKLFWAPGL